jgi:hypothetical protein
MFDFWYELPTWARAAFGSVLILIAGLLFLGGIGIRLPAIIGGTGLVFVLFSGAGNDKSGYNF